MSSWPRLQEMGCGPAAMPLKSTQPTELAAVLRQVLGDQAMLQKVRELSDQVRCILLACPEGPTSSAWQ